MFCPEAVSSVTHEKEGTGLDGTRDRQGLQEARPGGSDREDSPWARKGPETLGDNGGACQQHSGFRKGGR